jgi:16S rRNA C1402 (ribose-2'-O) methylase RsmI
MTKLHEEFIEATASDAAELFDSRDVVKGEFSVLVSAPKKV